MAVLNRKNPLDRTTTAQDAFISKTTKPKPFSPVPESTPKPIERTPDEVAQAREAGNEFIRRREKLESRLSGGREITGEIRELASEQAAAELENKGEQVSVAQAQMAGKTEAEALAKLEGQASETGQNALDKQITFRNATTGEMETTTLGESLGSAVTAVAILASVGSVVSSLTAGISVSLKGALGIGGASYFTNKFVGNARQGIQGVSTNYDSIINGVASGTITPEQAFELAAQLENALDDAERIGKISSANSVTNFLTGGKDILKDAMFARETITTKRILLAQAISLAQAGRTQQPRLNEI